MAQSSIFDYWVFVRPYVQSHIYELKLGIRHQSLKLKRNKIMKLLGYTTKVIRYLVSTAENYVPSISANSIEEYVEKYRN